MDSTFFHDELTDNILRFWIDRMTDRSGGGFYGRIDGDGVLHAQAGRGVVLNARILWTFSAAFRVLRRPEYLDTARRAYDYLRERFIDETYGGVYWEADYRGEPVNTKKQTYAQGFALYGFSEYYRATGDPAALQLAVDMYRTIETRCRDQKSGGYFEAFDRCWNTLDDMRLSAKDANECKSMNTHLHILEPYTNLYRIWPSEELRRSQSELLAIFTDHIIRHDGHLALFFDSAWGIRSEAVSFGHDIEAAWLLMEAAGVLADPAWVSRIDAIAPTIATAASEGLGADGGMGYERDLHGFDSERHWWVQAEAVVGYAFIYSITGDRSHAAASAGALRYIRQNLVDRDGGEWFWSRSVEGVVNRRDDKAGAWKCPYHNGRMCLVALEEAEIFRHLTETLV